MSYKDQKVAAVMLAGGQGSRLHELTDTTCKPAVLFAGGRRIVDWTMDNLARCAPQKLIIATQYRPENLMTHLSDRWSSAFAPGSVVTRDGMRASSRGYLGTADAVARNMPEIMEGAPDVVIVVAADHIYRMDYQAMIAAHRASGRPVTVAVDRVPLDQARAFGVMETDASGTVIDFAEKPKAPRAMADDASRALVSMGIYVFNSSWLQATLSADDVDPASAHDFGHDILPAAVVQGDVGAYDVAAHEAEFFWRDVGTLDALRETIIDIGTGRVACACPSYPSGANPAAAAQIMPAGTVILPGGQVSAGARLRRVIVAEGARVPADVVAGYDAAADAEWFRVTPQGTVLITAAMLARRSAERSDARTISLMLPRFYSIGA